MRRHEIRRRRLGRHLRICYCCCQHSTRRLLQRRLQLLELLGLSFKLSLCLQHSLLLIAFLFSFLLLALLFLHLLQFLLLLLRFSLPTFSFLTIFLLFSQHSFLLSHQLSLHLAFPLFFLFFANFISDWLHPHIVQCGESVLTLLIQSSPNFIFAKIRDCLSLLLNANVFYICVNLLLEHSVLIDNLVYDGLFVHFINQE